MVLFLHGLPMLTVQTASFLEPAEQCHIANPGRRKVRKPHKHTNRQTSEHRHHNIPILSLDSHTHKLKPIPNSHPDGLIKHPRLVLALAALVVEFQLPVVVVEEDAVGVLAGADAVLGLELGVEVDVLVEASQPGGELEVYEGAVFAADLDGELFWGLVFG